MNIAVRIDVSIATELKVKQSMSWQDLICGEHGLTEEAVTVLMGARHYLTMRDGEDEETSELPTRLAESMTEAICAAEALGL